jgi:hypothetical protein
VDRDQTLARPGRVRELTLGRSPATSRARGGAALHGELREGRNGQKGSRAADLRDGHGELLVGLAGTLTPASLGQTEGRVR